MNEYKVISTGNVTKGTILAIIYADNKREAKEQARRQFGEYVRVQSK
jgi:hypothetical protein